MSTENVQPINVVTAFLAAMEKLDYDTNNEWVIKRTAEAGPVVFMERVDRHQLAKGWTELPVSGVFEVHDGRISAWRDYFDFATIERGFAENS